MATHRYISTTFWDDAWIQELDPSEKFIYLYLMTNPLTSISGVYKITDRRISFDTGYDVEAVKIIMGKFSAAKKAIRFGEWVVLPTWPKHQNWEENQKIKQGIILNLNELPDEIFSALYDVGYRFDLDSVLSRRQEAGKSKKKENKETSSPSSGMDKPSIPYTYPMDSLSDEQDSPSSGMDRARTIELNSDSNSIQSQFNKEFVVEFNENSENLQSEQLVEKHDYKPTTTNFLTVQEEAKALGYFLTERQASAFLVLEHSWLSGRYNFFVFASKKISDDPVYSAKSQADQERIFSKGWKYENWLKEYPDWFKRQIQAEERKAMERLRKTTPKKCPRCGAAMDGRKCPSCNGWVQFNEESKKWEYQEPFDFKESLKTWKDQIPKPEKQPPPKNVDDIDF